MRSGRLRVAVELQHPAQCVECKRRMKPGVQVVFWREGGSYVYQHSPECPPKPREGYVGPNQPQAAVEMFVERQCVTCLALYQVPKGHPVLAMTTFVCGHCARRATEPAA